MRRWPWLGAAAFVLGTSLAVAQDAPQSILPPGFDDPEPAATPEPAPRPTSGPAPAQPSTGGTPVVQPLPSGPAQPSTPDLPAADPGELARLPTLDELERMSPDDLDELLGLKPKFDIPPGAQRSLTRVGIIAPDEGGLPVRSLENQPAALVRAALAGTRGQLVSRWGHILLRRALASRMAAPRGMNPVDFAALRAGVLNRIGEYGAARALVQDVDTNNWNARLTDHALFAYIATGDVVGTCPTVRLQGGAREDAQWRMLQAICNAYAGEGALAGTQLDRALRQGIAPRIDVLLAQRFAGAAGQGRRAVTIEWDDVEEISPWTFALSSAVGEEVPAALIPDSDPYYARVRAVAPMLPLTQRAGSVDLAAREGILSAAAMVDFYSQIYAEDAIEGDLATTASRLREAYVGTPAERWSAIQEIWGGTQPEDYGRAVLTAYAAARLAPNEAFADGAGALIASMLTAGLERDALAWAEVVEDGSEGWALLALARPGGSDAVDGGALDDFVDNDGSAESRKSKFLLAGLAGLGRIDAGDLGSLSDDVGIDLSRQSRWTRAISRAAEVNNAGLVALLAGLGMQGSGWDKMTALHLYHIVSALNAVGLDAEARMIAAEAVARA